MAHSASQEINGSTTGYFLLGSSSLGAQFVKLSQTGEVFITGSISVSSATSSIVHQGNNGSINQSWYTVLTDGTKIIGTGSSAPLYVNVANTGSISVITSTATSTITAVSQTLASTTVYTILTSNILRKGASFYKDGLGTAWLLLGSATPSSINFTVKLTADSSYEVPFNYTGPIKIIFNNDAIENYILSTEFT